MPEKVRMELRVDRPLSAAVKDIADELGISVNQLMQGVIRWAVNNAHLGSPYPGDGYIVETLDEPGVVWFGDEGCDEDGLPTGAGNVAFVLDFSDDRPIRSGSEFYPREEQ